MKGFRTDILFLLFLFVLYTSSVLSQNTNIDSLKLELKTEKNDSLKLELLHNISWALIKISPDESLEHAIQLENLASKKNALLMLAASYNIRGVLNKNKGKYDEAIEFYHKGYEIQKKLNKPEGMAASFNNLGNTYLYKSEYDAALNNYIKALKISEQINDSSGISKSYMNIGNIHYYQSNIPKALDYFKKSLNIKILSKQPSSLLASSYNNIGVLYEEQGKSDSALFYYEKALKHYQEDGEKYNSSSTLLNLSSLYLNEENLDIDKAKMYLQEALKIKEELGDKDGLAIAFLEFGNIYKSEQNFTKAEENYLKAYAIAFSIGNMQTLKESNQYLYKLYEETNQHKEAIYYLKNLMSIKDSILNEEKSHQIAEMSEKYESEKKDKEISLLNKENELHTLKISQQKNKLWISILIVIILAIILTSSIVLIRRKNQMNIELAIQRDEIERQKQIVENKNDEITDSIEYAKRIQSAILPPQSRIEKLLPNSFIFYKPKDIVAGDFYWLEQKDNLILFAACDCTGHGVPGAMVSVICNNGLNRSVRENGLTIPGEILDKTRDIVIEEFEKSVEVVKDGMDIAICSLAPSAKDTSTFILNYAGANNPLWIIRKESNVLEEIKPDKQYIGKSDAMENFTTHSTGVNKGDILYIFSDGFADQFGGEKGKKFKLKSLKQLLLSIHESSMSEQKETLKQTFETWKGDLEQVDDVCIIGVKI